MNSQVSAIAGADDPLLSTETNTEQKKNIKTFAMMYTAHVSLYKLRKEKHLKQQRERER